MIDSVQSLNFVIAWRRVPVFYHVKSLYYLRGNDPVEQDLDMIYTGSPFPTRDSHITRPGPAPSCTGIKLPSSSPQGYVPMGMQTGKTIGRHFYI